MVYRYEQDCNFNQETQCSVAGVLVAELRNEIIKGEGKQATGRGDDDLFIQSTRRTIVKRSSLEVANGR